MKNIIHILTFTLTAAASFNAHAAGTTTCPNDSVGILSCEDNRPVGEEASAIVLVCKKSRAQYFMFVGSPGDVATWPQLMLTKRSLSFDGTTVFTTVPADNYEPILKLTVRKNSAKALLTLSASENDDIIPGTTPMNCVKDLK